MQVRPETTRPWLFVLGAVLLVGVFYLTGIWQPLELLVYDWGQRLLVLHQSQSSPLAATELERREIPGQRFSPDGYVEVIAIDDRSLAALGRWPWPRSILARLLNILSGAGARVVVLDLLLSEAGEEDAGLLQTMAEIPHLILPYHVVGDYRWGHGTVSGQIIQPHIKFLPYAIFAHGDLLLDPDGTVRRVPVFLPHLDKAVPMSDLPGHLQMRVSPLALSLEAVRAFWQAESYFKKSNTSDMLEASAGVVVNGRRGKRIASGEVAVDARRLDLGPVTYPLDGRGNLLFTFPGFSFNSRFPWPPSRVHSFLHVLTGKVPASRFNGKIVFIGATATGLPDRHVSSLTQSGLIPGVFFHAAAASSLLTGRVIRKPDEVTVWGLMVLLAILQVGVGYRQKLIPATLLTGSIVALSIGAFIFLFLYYYLWIPVVILAGSTIIFYLSGVVYRYVTAQRARYRMLQSFRRYFSPAVVQEILTSEVELGTREVEGTVLFADLVGFTSRAERLSPQETVTMLNDCMTGLVQAVFRHDGTLDKFTGDGIMAFFGAPLPDPDHAEAAVAAAWEMQQLFGTAGDNLNETTVEDGSASHPGDKEPGDAIRKESKKQISGRPGLAVGVATGRFVVGNIGAKERFDYTAIGDVVNTAARLQQMAGAGEVLLDENTANSLGSDWIVHKLGARKVRGKSQPQEVIKLVGKRDERL